MKANGKSNRNDCIKPTNDNKNNLNNVISYVEYIN